MHDKTDVIVEDLPAKMKLDVGPAFDDFANHHSLMEMSVPLAHVLELAAVGAAIGMQAAGE